MLLELPSATQAIVQVFSGSEVIVTLPLRLVRVWGNLLTRVKQPLRHH